MFQITGTLKSKQAEQQVSDKFRKREFVITENSSQYPQMLSFQLTQDRCSLIENVNVGDEIKAGQVVCIIEAMKLFNEIESEISGRIVKVLVDNASPVEYDQPLFLVEPI